MAKLSISMSDTMNAFVAERINSGQYNNTSEYFRDLVRRDQERRQAEDDLRRMLTDADASGISERTVEEIWSAVETRLTHPGG